MESKIWSEGFIVQNFDATKFVRYEVRFGIGDRDGCGAVGAKRDRGAEQGTHDAIRSIISFLAPDNPFAAAAVPR
ncbi:Uncharacterised protein [Mycobacteroides abscessus subsp. abscessus]|nr:Uncharacterised protein [Mycobacteroides abscessus subsp. abscessus]